MADTPFYKSTEFSDAAAGAGGALEAISSIRGGYTSKALAELSALVFSSNADVYTSQAGLFASNANILKLQSDALGSQAEAAELGVDFAYAKGRQAESDVRYAGEATAGAERHWYASNHLDTAYGSPLLHQALTASQVEHDVGIVRASAQIDAADAETRHVNIMGQQVGVEGQRTNVLGQQLSAMSQAFGASTNAAVARVKGGEAVTAGYIGAGTSFLKTASKMASAGA